MLSINQQNPSLNSFSQTKKVLSHTSNQTVLQIDYPNRVSTKVVNQKKKKKVKIKKIWLFISLLIFLKKRREEGKRIKRDRKKKENLQRDRKSRAKVVLPRKENTRLASILLINGEATTVTLKSNVERGFRSREREGGREGESMGVGSNGLIHLADGKARKGKAGPAIYRIHRI